MTWREIEPLPSPAELSPVTTVVAAILIALALVDSLYNAGRALF